MSDCRTQTIYCSHCTQGSTLSTLSFLSFASGSSCHRFLLQNPDFLPQLIAREAPDVICIQEIKISDKHVSFCLLYFILKGCCKGFFLAEVQRLDGLKNVHRMSSGTVMDCNKLGEEPFFPPPPVLARPLCGLLYARAPVPLHTHIRCI